MKPWENYASKEEKKPWEKYANNDVPQEKVRPKKSYLESGVSGLADMLTLGHSDEIAAAGRAALGSISSEEDYSNLYDKYLNEQRAHKAQGREDNPGTYLTGNVAGAVIPALATGGASVGASSTGVLPRVGQAAQGFYRAINPVKGAGAMSNIGRGALGGAIMGAGQSNARPNAEESYHFGADVLGGAATGGVLSGAFSAAGKVGGYLKDKIRPSNVGAVLLGMPTEAAERYVKNPAAVNAAKPREELTQELIGSIGKLKDEVIGGSKASRDILAAEGQKFSRKDLAKFAMDRANKIIERGEGALDDADEAAVKYLQNQAAKLIGEATEEGAEFTTNRVKDLITNTRKPVRYEIRPGQFSDVDDIVKSGLARDWDQTLKARSPAYTEQMKQVAKDASLLDDVSSLAGTPQAMDNLLKRVQRDRAFFPAQKIGQLDQRMKTNFLNDLKLSEAKEALQRGAVGPGGSRMVNMYRELLSDIPLVGRFGGVIGGAVDKYGPAMGKEVLDKTAQLNAVVNNSEFLRSMGRYGPMLKAAAARGPAALVTTNQMLMRDPEYRNLVGPVAEEQ